VEKQKLKRMNMQSQLEGLKNQVNPHFLFNSLNTLTYLIPENSEKSVHFVQQLSKVYRYILEIRDKKLILLEEELNFLNAYTFLLKERFGKNLHIKIDIPEVHLNDKIIPLSLQILFENAIKHNIISSEKPLFMEVFIENGNKLIVKNNLQKKNQVMNSTKLGLQNIKNRYRFFSEKEVEVIVTQESFIVILPMIDVPVFAGND
jgi:LytS/YehU family sensor histidine kinase